MQSASLIRGLLATLLFSVSAALTVTLIAADQDNAADDALYEKVNSSTLTFTGKVDQMKASNVASIDPQDDTMTVTVNKVVSGNEEALKKFGSLEGKQLTVVADSSLRAGLAKNTSAVFFVDPLVYEKNIAVTASGITAPGEKATDEFAEKLSALAARKSESVLRSEVAGADLIVTGTVKSVNRLPSDKRSLLESLAPDQEPVPENREARKEAVVDVHTIEKPSRSSPFPGPIVIEIPAMSDCLVSQPEQRIVIGLPRIWFLHKNQIVSTKSGALSSGRELETPSPQSYSTLSPADVQSATRQNLERIRRMIKATNQ